MSTNLNLELKKIANECGLELHNGRLYLIGGSPCGSFRDDWRNIGSDMRKVMNMYKNKK